jgi:hypothetical protein
MTYYKLSKEQEVNEARTEALRALTQKQARDLKLGRYDQGFFIQARIDAERYLNAKVYDEAANDYVDPSPQEKVRRQKYLDDLNKQFGPTWQELFLKRDLTPSEIQQNLTLQTVEPLRRRQITEILTESARSGVPPGFLVDNYNK